MTNRSHEVCLCKSPELDHLLSDTPAWLMATAFEVEAGRLSLDQARARIQRHGLRIADAPCGSVGWLETDGQTTTAAFRPLRPVGWLDPVSAWQALRPENQRRIGAAAIAAAVSNLGANVAIEMADPIACRQFLVAESEALSLIFELVNVNVLGGDDTTLPPRPDLRPLGIRQCRKCGCTDDYACDGGCDWIEPDLCSSCVSLGPKHPAADHGEQR